MVGCLYRGRCPRLLKVVPSRHRSACGMRVIWIPSRHQSACGFYFITDFTDWTDFTDFTDFTVRGDCALMRPIGLGEYVTGICSRRVLAFPSDRLTHILPLAGHHKSTIITNATHVLGQLLRSKLTDSCPIGSIRDLFPFRLPMGRPDGWGGSDRQARLHG